MSRSYNMSVSVRYKLANGELAGDVDSKLFESMQQEWNFP